LARNSGYAVFPCLPNKRPACPHGFMDASKDPANIATLWRRYSGPLIGIATGEASGFDVLDVDCGDWPPNAKPELIEKRESARAWWRANEHRIPPTRTYRTQSGGMHLYYRHADGIKNSASKIAQGIDTRGTGGYAISWFAAGYECLDHTPATPWPDWLLNLATAPPAAPPAPSRSIFGFAAHGSPANDGAVAGALRKVATAPEGERNAILHWASCRLGERVAAGQITPPAPRTCSSGQPPTPACPNTKPAPPPAQACGGQQHE
jgi:hypothetical protein